MFSVKNKGKITISLEKDGDRINSNMTQSGIAKTTDIALTTLLINFVSMSIEKGKDPEQLIAKHLPVILEMVQAAKKI